METPGVEERARRHASLGEPTRLAIVDELVRSDRTTVELGRRVGLASNLLAYHLDVLEGAGVIRRCVSTGDRRRRYVCLQSDALAMIGSPRGPDRQPALFICTQNSARSQLAAALWQHLTDTAAVSAGTDPARQVHRSAVAAARRAGLDITDARPRHLNDLDERPELVVTVCDRAHEQLDTPPHWLHWSIPDPVALRGAPAFDAAIDQLRQRITNLAAR